MSNQELNNETKAEILQTAVAIIDKKIDIIEGCRKLVGLSYKTGISRELFYTFIGIASETEDIPSENERSQWSSEALLEKDNQKAKYISMIQIPVTEACREIIEVLSNSK
jgi:hypothetical protein